MRYIVHCQIYCRYCGYSVVDVADMFCKCCRYWAVTDRWRHESHISALCTRKISHFLQYIQPHQGDAHPPPPPLLLRCPLGAASYPPGLAARGVRTLLSGVSASLGHRSAPRPASSLRSEPRLLTARTLRGSVPPRLHDRLPPLRRQGGSGRRPPTFVSPAMTPIGRLGGV